MPNADLDAAFVRQAVCEEGKVKTDYYDNAITGFLLECRATGGKTYALRYRDPHGRQRQHKIGDTKSISFDKARSAAERLRSRVVLGENPAEEKKAKRAIPRISELYFQTYLPHVQSYRRNMDSDLSFWKNHVLPKFGDKHLDELTSQEILDAQLAMRRDGYSAGMSNKWIVQLRFAFVVGKKFAVPGTEKNPAAGIKQFRIEGRERFLSQEETERLRVAVARSDNKQLKFFVALALLVGLRKREILDAKWEDVDLERRLWRIPLSKTGRREHVVLSQAAVAILEKLPRWKGCPFVLPNPKSLRPFTDLHESFQTACRRAKIQGCRIHDLRHTFASNLVNAGQSLFVVSKALRHSSTQMSERYAHIADHALINAADAAASAMGSAWTEAKQPPATSQN